MKKFAPYQRVRMFDYEQRRWFSGYYVSIVSTPWAWHVPAALVEFDNIGFCECDLRALEAAPLGRRRARGLRP